MTGLLTLDVSHLFEHLLQASVVLPCLLDFRLNYGDFLGFLHWALSQLADDHVATLD